MVSLDAHPKSVCLLDWDGTLRNGFVIYDWLKFLVKSQMVDAHFEQQMTQHFTDYKNQLLTYEEMAELVVNTFANAFEGQDSRVTSKLIGEFWEHQSNLFEFTRPLIDLLNEIGVTPIVISGSPKSVVQHMARKIGVQECYGLELQTRSDHTFVGTVRTNTAVAKYKQSIVDAAKSNGKKVVYSFGDSVSDRPLFEAAERAFCITAGMPTKKLEEEFGSLVASNILTFVTPKKLADLVATNAL